MAAQEIPRLRPNEERQLAVVGEPSLMQLIGKAMEMGRNAPTEMVAAMRELAQLKREAEADQAKKEYYSALHRFQRTVPMIPKLSIIELDASGKKKNPMYADLQTIVDYIDDTRKDCGFIHTFSSHLDGAVMRTTCLLSHVGGHQMAHDAECRVNDNLKLGSTQKDGWAISYTQRKALIAAYGLTQCDAGDMDIAPDAADPISENQVAAFKARIAEAGPLTQIDDLLAWLKVERVEDITKGQWHRANQALNQIMKRMKR